MLDFHTILKNQCVVQWTLKNISQSKKIIDIKTDCQKKFISFKTNMKQLWKWNAKWAENMEASLKWNGNIRVRKGRKIFV